MEDCFKSLSRVPGTIANELSKQNKSLSNVFLISNNDRFGESVQPKKPKDMRPPPGNYESVNIKSKECTKAKNYANPSK